MDSFRAAVITSAFQKVSSFHTAHVGLLRQQPEIPASQLPEDAFLELKQEIEDIRAALKEAGLPISLDAADKVAAELNKVIVAGGKATFDRSILLRLDNFARYLINTLPSELRRRCVLIMPAGKAELYQSDEPEFGTQFGAEVATKFRTKGKQEVGEAANCFALGRDTAYVFHLMRTLEVALDAISLCLRVPRPLKPGEKTWGAILGRLKTELDNRENLMFERQWTDMSEGGDKLVFRRIYASLDAIKGAYRDPTMHVESVYTEREARHLFALCKGFMEIVASRLDEKGEPLA
jgi:hypothetical protein